MYNAPYQGVANQLSQYGRYGDSMLVHMNPVEVQGLASLSPTGQLTRNPVTGQPEAFLPFLAPLLGSFLGQAFLPAIATGLGATGVGTALASNAALAGAIGSGLATTAATGDLEQGILSGITGYGIGSALGASGIGNEGVKQATQNLTTQEAVQATLDDATTKALTEATQKEVAARAAMPVDLAGPTAFSSELAGAPEMLGNLQNFPFAAQDPAYLQALSAQKAGQTGLEAARQGLQTAKANIPISERLTLPFREPGAMLNQLTKPSSFLPVYVGESGRIARAMELEGEGSARAFAEKEEADREKARGQIASVFDVLRRDYPVNYVRGGEIKGYFDGGSVERDITNALLRFGTIPAAENVQSSLRGTVSVPPPAASYSALDVGGEGYLPGVSEEFVYFREPEVEMPPNLGAAPGTTPPGDYFDPNFDLDDFLSRYRGGYQDLAIPSGMPMQVISPRSAAPQSNLSGIAALEQFKLEDLETPIYERLMEQTAAPVNSEKLQTPEEESAIPKFSMEDLMAMRNLQLNPIPFQEGGMVSEPGEMMEEMIGPEDEMGPMRAEYDALIEMAIAAIRGEAENPDEIIKKFIEEFGNDAFVQLREAVLQSIVPGAQTEGMVEGEGGGQDDMVDGMIGSQQRVAVSPGEYIIPADAVAMAGGGYSGAGAEFFDNLVDDIRMKTMGTREQVRPYKERMA